MVMVKLCGPITEIEGKEGGNIWRVDVCGQHLQSLPTPRSTPKPFYSQHKAFSKCTRAWSNRHWTKPELDRWWIWCEAHPKISKKGKITYFHPFLAFLHVNIKRLLAGKEIIYIPP